MTVMAIESRGNSNCYVCSRNKGVTNKEFRRDEIELFSVYWDKKKA